MKILAPTNPKDRFEVYRFFNGLSAEAKEGLNKRYLRMPLVKTFLLEHVSNRGNGKPTSPDKIFQEIGATISRIDDNFMSLKFIETDKETNRSSQITTGYLEKYDERFFAYYTCEDSTLAKKRVAKWIQSPDLDFSWFSSPLLQALWEEVVVKRGDERFGKLVFRHESIFDMPQDFAISDDSCSEDLEDESQESQDNFNEDQIEFERRKARFSMGDRIGKIKKALKNLQENYDPLYALYSLRFPSRIGKGSHDLYQTGQITNRTDNFEEHRNMVRYLYKIYKEILNNTEESAWQDIKTTKKVNIGLRGVPLIVKFTEPLSEATFNRWIQMAFQKRNRFKLWGEPIRLGPTKVHVYGADRHLWQPINLEMTSNGMVAILSQGTCGNSFHRLVTNIQHYVCPKIMAWVGSESYEELVKKWPSNLEESNEDDRSD